MSNELEAPLHRRHHRAPPPPPEDLTVAEPCVASSYPSPTRVLKPGRAPSRQRCETPPFPSSFHRVHRAARHAPRRAHPHHRTSPRSAQDPTRAHAMIPFSALPSFARRAPDSPPRLLSGEPTALVPLLTAVPRHRSTAALLLRCGRRLFLLLRQRRSSRLAPPLLTLNHQPKWPNPG